MPSYSTDRRGALKIISAIGATCDSDDGTCVALLATGAPCTSDAQCEGSCSAGECLSGAQQTLCGP